MRKKWLGLKHLPVYALLLGILVFILLKLLVLSRFHLVIWDEAVYLTMGKFMITNGALGYWEILRPPLLPIVLAVVEMLGDAVVIGELLMGAIAILGSILMYRLLSPRIHRGVALGISLLLLFTPLWFEWSHRILTGVPSAVLLLGAGFAYAKKRPMFAGFLAALAFLLRFPAGLGIAAIGGTYGVFMLQSWWYARKPVLNDATKELLKFCAPVAVLVGVWLIANWIAWHGETATWTDAAFRPLLLGSNNVFAQNLWLYDASYGFYFWKFLTVIPVTVFALWGVLRLKKHKELIPLALTGILGLAFFTYLPHNEWRFALLTLPGILVLTALGFEALARAHIPYASVFAVGLILLNVGFAVHDDIKSIPGWSHEPPEIVQYYEFLAQHPVAGDVIVSDPVVAWYIPNKIIPAYFDPYLLERSLPRPHVAIAFSPAHFPCASGDSDCEASVQKSIDRITTQQRLVYEQEFQGNSYYVFSDQNYLPPLSVDNLRADFDLAEKVSLSDRPYDVLPVVFILEDFPSLDDTGQAVWRVSRYEKILKLFRDRPATVSAIPTHIHTMNVVRPFIRQELEGFEIAQNGFDHSSLPGREQREEIEQGRNILSEVLGVQVNVFIPPYYAADSITASVLSELGYRTYISTPGDSVEVAISRLDQTNTLIVNWEDNVHKEPLQVLQDIHLLSQYSDYALMSVYYFTYDDFLIQKLNNTVQELESRYILMTASEVTAWREFRALSNITVSGEEVLVSAPVIGEGLTLLIRSDVNMTITSPVPVSIRNVGQETVKVCIDVCDSIEPGYFFLSKSAMVIPPPDAVLDIVSS